jgi:hypothetical protein
MIRSLTKATLLLTFNFSSLSWQAEAATVYDITQFTTDHHGFEIDVGTDNQDNFIAAFLDDVTVYGTFSAGGTAWTTPAPISSGATEIGDIDVAMDETSTGLAIWTQLESGVWTTNTSFFSGGTWTPITPVLETSVNFLNDPSIAMNGTGNAVAAWVNNPDIHASIFSGGAWTPFQTIGTQGGGGVDVAYSSNGVAVAAWVFFPNGNIFVNVYNGASWQPTPAQLATDTADSDPSIGIDANGNAIVVWSGAGDGQIIWSRFNGTLWSQAAPIYSATGNGMPEIAVASDGTAIAVWPDASNLIQMSQFNGASWSIPIPIGGGTEAAITMDSNGDALISWVTTLNQLYTALFPKGGTLQAPVFVTSSPASIDITNVGSALSSLSSLGSLVWIEAAEGERFDTFGTFVAFGPTPPLTVDGFTCVTHGISGDDRVNIITWTPSIDTTVVAYDIYRDGVLIAIVPASGPFIFYDHNRCRGLSNTYCVTAVNAGGIKSAPVCVTLD